MSGLVEAGLRRVLDEPRGLRSRCPRTLERLRSSPVPWFLTWGIVFEFLRLASDPRVYHRRWAAPIAHAFLEALLRSPSARLLIPTARPAEILAASIADVPEARGTLLRDLHAAYLMREHGVGRIVTRDRGFEGIARVVPDPRLVERTRPIVPPKLATADGENAQRAARRSYRP